MNVEQIESLIKRAKSLRVPLPFVVTFEDGHTENLDGGGIMALVSENRTDVRSIEMLPEAAGQGKLKELVMDMLKA